MLEPFATLAFLAVLWLAARWMLDLLEADGVRIASALSGRPTLAMSGTVRPISARFQPRAAPVRRRLRVPPQWRVAA